jgi:hypothetical protein
MLQVFNNGVSVVLFFGVLFLAIILTAAITAIITTYIVGRKKASKAKS